MAGYSGTPLAKKLGIKPGTAFAVLGAPPGYLESLAPPPEARNVAKAKGAELVQLFVTQERELQKQLPALVRGLPPSGALWVSWPKGKQKAAIPTDLDENRVRALGLAAGLVDVKVCAVDEIWSGLKLVFRLADRPAVAKAKKP